MDKEEMQDDGFWNLFQLVKARKTPILIGFLTVLAITAAGAFFVPSVYESAMKVSITLPAVPRDLSLLQDFQDARYFINNQPVVASSRWIYEKVVRELGLDAPREEGSFVSRLRASISGKKSDPFEAAIRDLIDRTDIQLERGTSVLVISARSRSLEEAISISQTLARTYADYANGLILSKAATVFDAANTQAEAAERELEDARNAVQSAKRRMGGEDRAVLVARLVQQRAAYEQVQDRIMNFQERTVEKPAEVQPAVSPRMLDLQRRLAIAKEDLEAALRKYTEKHPAIKNLRSQIAKLENELAQESAKLYVVQEVKANPVTRNSGQIQLNQSLSDLERRRENLSQQIKALEMQLLQLSLGQSELEMATRDLTASESQYAMLKERLENARILRDQAQDGTIKVIDDRSLPPKASNKRRLILLAVGFIASIVFGLAAGFISEYMDDSLKSLDNIERVSNLPVLAVVPHMQNRNKKDNESIPGNRQDRKTHASGQKHTMRGK